MRFGSEAIFQAGFPIEVANTFAGDIFVLTPDPELKAISIAIRAGQRPNTDMGFEVSPKPMAVKTKTCSDAQGIPLLSGFIPRDQETFGREHSKPTPDKGFMFVEMNTRLQDILIEAQKNNYKMWMEGNKLNFQAIKSEPKEKQKIVFSIDLTKSKEAVKLENETEENILPRYKKSDSLKKPEGWDEKIHGNFEEQVKKLFPVSYQKPNENAKPLELLATPDGRPITGDADILWITMPTKMIEMAKKKYNPTDAKQLEELLTEYIKLKVAFTGTQLSPGQLYDELKAVEQFARTSGIITPYELLFAKVANDEMERTIPHFKNLFQHGPEIYNPGEPSPLDSSMLHFYKGMAVLTESEDELVDFVMQKGYLEEHYIRIHPGWNMEKWWPVIAKQEKLGHPISDETLKNYNDYKKQHANEIKSYEKKPLSSTALFLQELRLDTIQYSDMVKPPPLDSIIAPEEKSMIEKVVKEATQEQKDIKRETQEESHTIKKRV